MAMIEQEFREQGIQRGGVLMLPPRVALAMVERARQLGCRVLGIDGFYLTPTSTEPSLAHSIDLSARAPADGDCWAAAEAFLEGQLASGLYFEVVIE